MKINKSILLYKRISGECLSYYSNADVNGRTSRRDQINLVCPLLKRETEGGKSFSVSTSPLWNIIQTSRNQSLNILFTAGRKWTVLLSKFKIFFAWKRDCHRTAIKPRCICSLLVQNLCSSLQSLFLSMVDLSWQHDNSSHVNLIDSLMSINIHDLP